MGLEHTCDFCECGHRIGEHYACGAGWTDCGCKFSSDLYCEEHDTTYERKYAQCINCATWLFCPDCKRGPFLDVATDHCKNGGGGRTIGDIADEIMGKVGLDDVYG